MSDLPYKIVVDQQKRKESDSEGNEQPSPTKEAKVDLREEVGQSTEANSDEEEQQNEASASSDRGTRSDTHISDSARVEEEKLEDSLIDQTQDITDAAIVTSNFIFSTHSGLSFEVTKSDVSKRTVMFDEMFKTESSIRLLNE